MWLLWPGCIHLQLTTLITHRCVRSAIISLFFININVYLHLQVNIILFSVSGSQYYAVIAPFPLKTIKKQAWLSLLLETFKLRCGGVVVLYPHSEYHMLSVLIYVISTSSCKLHPIYFSCQWKLETDWMVLLDYQCILCPHKIDHILIYLLRSIFNNI